MPPRATATTIMGAIKPRRLRSGDALALVSLSSGAASCFPHVIASATRVLAERFGWRLVAAPNSLRDAEALYRDPRARADDLHWALLHDGIAGVLTAIGGDDSIRVAPLLDLALIRRRPKVLVGFSDTTITHAVYARAGVVSFYGPSVMAGIADGDGLPGTLDSLGPALGGHGAPWDVEPMPGWTDDPVRWEREDYQEAVRQPQPLQPGTGHVALQGAAVVEGHLVGGCAEVLEMMKGTPVWYPDSLWDGAILLLETSEMVPGPEFVELWLRNYAAQGVLRRLSGLVLARPRGYDGPMRERLAEGVRRLLAEAGRDDLPVLADVDAGHLEPMHTLPLSCRVRLDPARARLTVLEDGVA